MVRFTLYALCLLLAAGTLSFNYASTASIGMANATGSFQLDRATVTGNATVFDGTLVETKTVPSSLSLDGGAQVQLGTASRGKVYRGRLVLEQGQTRVRRASGLRVEALNLRIVPESGALVTLGGDERVRVEATSGAVRVTSSEGVLLANLASGAALDFQPQAAGAAAPVTVTGCLVQKNGHFFLTDSTANVTFEVRGTGLQEAAGHSVEITGASLRDESPAAGASSVIRAAKVVRGSGSCSDPAVPVAGKPGKKNSTAKMSRTTKALIGGVVIAGAAAGAAVTVSDDSEEKTISR
ncbi:MAG: hypothetical protein ABFD60_12845 [Bryobacteraceae bacterium]